MAVIGLIELTRAGNIVSSQTADPIVAYKVVGAFYFVICFVLSSVARRFERRLEPAPAPRVGDALTALNPGARK